MNNRLARIMWHAGGHAHRVGVRALRDLLSPLEQIMPEPAAIAIKLMLQHKDNIGRYPNLIRPRSFNEKLLHRMVFDRRLFWTRLQDKYAVREYVTARVGTHILPKLYWVTQNPADIPFGTLPERFVVKPTHASGWYRLVRGNGGVDRQALIQTCSAWLKQNYYAGTRDWVYKYIEPRILVEQYIDDGTGPDPIRYKFYVFHGTVRAAYVGVGSPGRARCGFYDRRWNRLLVTFAGKQPIGELNRPKHWEEMLRCAETLAQGLDFIRVDLYDAPAGVYFGELTTTPGGGISPYTPPEFDDYLGGFWRLPNRAERRQEVHPRIPIGSSAAGVPPHQM